MHNTSVDGAVQAAVLLAMVWQVWVYTTWATNYLDPRRQSVRAMLLVLMLGSLVLASALPRAFEDRGLLVATMYAAMQVGRCVFVIVALRGERLQLAFVRILGWSVGVLAGLLAVAPHVSALTLAIAVLAVVVGVAVSDRIVHPA